MVGRQECRRLGHEMATKRVKVVLVSALGLALLLAMCVWLLTPRDIFTWDAPPRGTVVAESVSPDRALVARVIAGAGKGQYVFELRRAQGGELMASEAIAAPVGYHQHIVKVRWVNGSARAVATVDHDFGENNLDFQLGL